METFPLHGVCRHQERRNWVMLFVRCITRKILIMLRYGVNAVRLAHYPDATHVGFNG